jgi:hypothetical protein
LPFVRRPCGSQILVKDGVSTNFSGVIKELTSINPSPPVRIPFHGGRFPVEKPNPIGNHIFISVLLRASSGVNNFNLMGKTFHLPIWAARTVSKLLPQSLSSFPGVNDFPAHLIFRSPPDLGIIGKILVLPSPTGQMVGFLHLFEVYVRDSSKMINKFPEVLNFNR